MEKDIRTTIRGILIPDAWDELGNVVAVALFTFQEEKIRIIDDRLGQALKHHVRKQVTVDGEMIFQDPSPSIRVRHYRVDSG